MGLQNFRYRDLERRNMIWINSFLIIVMIAICMIFVGYRKDYISKISDQKGIHKIFYPFGLFVYDRCLRSHPNKASDSMKYLYPLEEPGKMAEKYYILKICIVIEAFLLINVLSLIISLSQPQNNIINQDGSLERNSYGQGETSYKLFISSGEIAETEEIEVNVSERQYKSDEIQDLFAEAKSYIDSNLPGGNESLEAVTQSLNFFETIPETGISIDWKVEDYNFISANGEIKLENVEESGVVTSVTADVHYFEHSMEYIIPLKIICPDLSDKEKFIQEINQQLEDADLASITESALKLPEIVGNYSLQWSEPKNHISRQVTLLGLIIAAGLFFYKDQKLKETLKVRNDQLLLDYPEIIYKMVLLLNAGMTIRGAWEKLVFDYQNRIKKTKRYVYEEMIVAMYAMENGTTETRAYESFGKRCMIQQYLKFSSLIIQCLKKGAKGSNHLLIEAAEEAELVRRERAKCLGEEASTKLLMPMVCLLVIVLVIIMFPAFISINL